VNDVGIPSARVPQLAASKTRREVICEDAAKILEGHSCEDLALFVGELVQS
jgi:hypothetical protein